MLVITKSLYIISHLVKYEIKDGKLKSELNLYRFKNQIYTQVFKLINSSKINFFFIEMPNWFKDIFIQNSMEIKRNFVKIFSKLIYA